MSVYTSVSPEQLGEILSEFELGDLLGFEGIAAAIENTNYFLTTSAGKFVLTIFETLPVVELDYFLELMAHLADRNIPNPVPVKTRGESFLGSVSGKPCAVVNRLEGKSVSVPTKDNCRQVGAALAQLHLAAADFEGRRVNDRGGAWRAGVLQKAADCLPAEDLGLIDALGTIADIESWQSVPQGVVHADLFRDNVLFAGEQLSGIIDFYYAFNGPLIYDLAIVAADWAWVPFMYFEPQRAAALVAGYTSVRPVLECEVELWTDALAAAGLRFYLSRVHDMCFPKSGERTQLKDPAPFAALFRATMESRSHFLSVWE